MSAAAITARILRHANAYFSAIESASLEGRFAREDGTQVSPIYPTMLLICETPTHFVAEFLGASPKFDEIRAVHRSLPSLAVALGQFPTSHSVHSLMYGGRSTGCGLSHLALLSERGHETFRARYREFPDLHQTSLLYGGSLLPDEAFHPLGFTDELQDFWLSDVMMVAEWHGFVRARYFQAGFILHRSMSSSQLQRHLAARYPVGTDTTLLTPSTDDNRTLLIRAANFASLAVTDKVGETTITKFLESNSSMLTIALGVSRIIPQPSLKWIEGNPDPEERAIQPDFLLIDDKGDAHLCEVKLPLLSRNDLTTGKHKRRRFVTPVVEGIAQLANYREYLSFDSHRQLLAKEYGVSVRDPRSILIVGSAENYDGEIARQAQRMLTPFELIDYDTLRVMYLAGSGYVPGVQGVS
ncbi:MAG TPA: Shedu anti-phage system protein SduA domain-containing protein [Tepidiformaceae bacterium]